MGGAPRFVPGLRLQIVLALAGVILLAYVPLFFAIAQVTRATSLAYREEAAKGFGRAVAAHVADVRRTEFRALGRTLESHVGEGGAIAIVVYGPDGDVVAAAGPSSELSAVAPPPRPYAETVTRVSSRAGRALDVVLPDAKGAVLVRVRTEDDAARGGQLVRGIALYMTVFALGLLVIAYIVLTRTLIRPIEQLARAADKVASGARVLEVPHAGARELAELGASVREMAARLLRDEEKLRAKVDELTTTTRRLTETREQLEGSERMASVGKLAAGVAHEIGNPIAAIMGMHDLLEDGELPSDARADFLRRMRNETERINVVVRDLLDYARPDREVSTDAPATASVGDVAADALALVRPQKEWRAVDAHLEIESPLHVAISAHRLTQVLLNLLLNAGAALTKKPPGEPRTVVVRARPDGDARVRIEVEDDGPGVPPELRERVFDPFVTTKDVGSGTGLGLSVCRGIVDAARGKIYVDPGCDRGARFVVELPRATASDAINPVRHGDDR